MIVKGSRVSGATFSEDGKYRYHLWRRWAPGPLLAWVMLNPSTADEDVLDPTLRRCQTFTMREGRYSGFVVANVFSYRATDPAELARQHDPFGDDVDVARRVRAVSLDGDRAEGVVAAWGAHQMVPDGVLDLLVEHAEMPVFVLGWTKSGAPRHPLYVKGDTPFTLVHPTP